MPGGRKYCGIVAVADYEGSVGGGVGWVSGG